MCKIDSYQGKHYVIIKKLYKKPLFVTTDFVK